MFWKKKPKIKPIAYVLVSEEEVARAFVEDVQASFQQEKAPLVISHFTDTHKRVQHLLEAQNIQCKTLTSISDLKEGRLDSMTRMKCVPLIPFPLLQMASPFPEKEAQVYGSAEVLVPEIHPTRRRDLIVESFAASLPFHTTLYLYAAIRSPLMSQFMDPEKLEGMLTQMGIKLDERIEHTLLASSLSKAQLKIEKSVSSEKEAPSIEEWLQQNLPNGM